MWAIGENLEMFQYLGRRISYFMLLAAKCWIKLMEQLRYNIRADARGH